AEMPGFYPGGEYDLAGFCVGIVEKRHLLDGSRVEVGDVIVGLASGGLHSNGFSLARKIVEESGLDWSATPDELGGKSLGEELLTPTQIYVIPVLELLRVCPDMIRGMAHITGGGLPENLPRCLNKGQSVQLYPKSWEIPPVFRWLAQRGNVSETAMFETFNMGIGFAVVVERDRADEAIAAFGDRGLKGYAIGTVISAG
ncbi:MAG: phosphoribosylformylglycinamidine cyclo-ligase, partial [Cyanobacteriota bacterium]|nr:phosphoribosylformylglycinamidine cyclo-ligase [Cyanobacteriota bacterium]